MPYITEELYHNLFIKNEKVNSIHLNKWPETIKIENKNALEIGEELVKVASYARQEKTKIGKSLKEPIKTLVLNKKILKEVERDIKAVTQTEKIEYGKELKIEF